MSSHLSRVKSQLTLQSRRRVLSQLEGEFTSLHTGPGIDFHDLREYVRGDDVKDLDWKASARTGGLLVKRFTAVRKHTVLLVVSTGRSMAAHHSLTRTKADAALEVAAVVGYLAARQADLVGAVHGDAGDQESLPPRVGELHLGRCLEAAAAATSAGSGPSDTAALLGHVARTRRTRAIVLLVCDDEEVTPQLRTAVRRAVVQHELLIVTVGDLDPASVPVGVSAATDVDTGWLVPDWARDDDLARELSALRAERQRRLHDELTALGAVHQHLASDASALSVVRRLLLAHRHAHRR